MNVYVNGKGIDLPAGMTVRHALIAAGIDVSDSSRVTIRDEWSNEVGLGGALSEGYRLFIAESGPCSDISKRASGSDNTSPSIPESISKTNFAR